MPPLTLQDIAALGGAVLVLVYGLPLLLGSAVKSTPSWVFKLFKYVVFIGFGIVVLNALSVGFTGQTLSVGPN